MMEPNARARRHGQGTPGTCFPPRINKQPPKYYAPLTVGFPVTSGGTTPLAKGGLTPKGRVAEQPLRQLSFATLLAVQAGNSTSSLSQSTKTSLKGICDGPNITNPYLKKTRSEPSQKSHLEETKDYSRTMLKMTRN